MAFLLPPNQFYYRITTRGYRWRDVLSGRGALSLSPGGNRYNVVLQRAAYVCNELGVTITEFAYYAARDWQERLGNHHIVAVPTPMRGTYTLWQFTLQQPTYVIDVEAGLPVHAQLPPFALLNPGHNYAATHWVANNAIATLVAGHNPPHPGLKVPAVRSRQGAAGNESNYVLYKLAHSPQGTLTGRWRVQIEFRDIAGNAVAGGSARVDWSHPRFQLLTVPGGAPPALPHPYAVNIWYPIVVNFQ
jgi:hypothetical protein